MQLVCLGMHNWQILWLFACLQLEESSHRLHCGVSGMPFPRWEQEGGWCSHSWRLTKYVGDNVLSWVCNDTQPSFISFCYFCRVHCYLKTTLKLFQKPEILRGQFQLLLVTYIMLSLTDQHLTWWYIFLFQCDLEGKRTKYKTKSRSDWGRILVTLSVILCITSNTMTTLT